MENKLSRWTRAALKGSRTKVGLVMAAGGLTFAAAVYAASVASLGLFELDVPSANATDDPNVAGDDSNQIYCDQVDPMPRTPLGECDGVAPASASQQTAVFVADKVGDGDDVFTGGSTKDVNNTSSWLWEIGAATPEKNDISNAFASIHVTPGGETILYVGLDRSSNNGDASIGFWILQNGTNLVPGPTPQSDGTFSAPHKNGDVLIQSDITNGGAVSRFDVYTWQAGGLTPAFESTNCGSASADDRACGVTNTGAVDAPWPYTPKQGTAGTFPAVSYFEGGVNLTALFPQGIPCLSTFLAETRTSQSEDAVLKDFALGQFELCSFNIVKTGPAIAKVGDVVTYSITITNTGALPLTKVEIVDSLVGDLTNDPDCGATLAPNASCTIEYEYTIPSGSNADVNLENTVTATYGVLQDEITASSTATIDLFKPGVTLVKKVNTVDEVQIFQGDAVNYSITVDNTSSTGTPTLSCTVTDVLVNIDPTNSDLDNNTHTLGVTLASGVGPFVINASSGALNTVGTITNTASVSCTPSPYTNVVSASDSVMVKVVARPVGITVDKTGSAFSKVGDDVDYVVTIGNPNTADGKLPVRLTSIVDNRIGNLTDGTHLAITSNTCPITPNTLAVGATCTIGLKRTTLVGDADPFVNTVTVTGTDAFGSADTENDSHSTDLVAPKFTVTKDCLAEPVKPGDSANFRIRVTNTGNVELNTHIVDTLLGIDQTVVLGTGTCVYDSDPGDGCLEIEDGVTVGNEPVSNTVTVTATLPDQYGLANVLNAEAGDTCDVAQGGDATRTLGFWKAHGSDGDRFAPPVDYGYTCHVAEDHVRFPIDLGWKTLVNCEDVFGIFWSSPAKQTNGSKRPALCQTKLHASWQLMAAILNEGLDNGETIPNDPVSGLPADDALRLALQGTDRAKITRLAGLLGGYNESGDDVAIEDADGAVIPPADPNGAKAVADLTIGNCQ